MHIAQVLAAKHVAVLVIYIGSFILDECAALVWFANSYYEPCCGLYMCTPL